MFKIFGRNVGGRRAFVGNFPRYARERARIGPIGSPGFRSTGPRAHHNGSCSATVSLTFPLIALGSAMSATPRAVGGWIPEAGGRETWIKMRGPPLYVVSRPGPCVLAPLATRTCAPLFPRRVQTALPACPNRSRGAPLFFSGIQQCSSGVYLICSRVRLINPSDSRPIPSSPSTQQSRP